jgi:hypothetical protein
MKALDESKLQEFIGKVVNEWDAATSALTIFIGDRLERMEWSWCLDNSDGKSIS